LRPNSEMLKTLKLKPGCNTIVYTVQGGIQGEKTLAANIYLWPANSKIIISDIDGTITKYFSIEIIRILIYILDLMCLDN